MELKITECFLDSVMKKFHFGSEERELFHQIGQEVEDAAAGRAGFWCAGYRDTEKKLAAAALTLGAGVDELQDRFAQKGLLTEMYMAETIAEELLLAAYRDFNRWMEKKSGLHVARYFFFGAQEAYPLSELPSALKLLEQQEVQCNRVCCLTPKKSVVFLAELTDEENVRCEGICMGCGRKDCPNRWEENDDRKGLRWPDLTAALTLPYGYARILGR